MSLPAMSRQHRRAREARLCRGGASPTRTGAPASSTLLPQGREALARVSEARNAVVAAFAATLPDDERTALRDALLPIAERIGPA